jgi:16S rRNA (uracil1498-N3)-methyltransferase
MNLFYIPAITADSKQIILSEEESKHACRVLRLKNGDLITLMDGVGGTYLAEIVDANPKRCAVSILNYEFKEKESKSIHIAIAPTKNMDRIEWFLEKTTELGIDEITLLLCKNSERKLVKEDRLEKILVSAMKQSKRTYLPKLNLMTSFKDFVNQYPQAALAHCYENEKKTLNAVFQPNNYPILIGPEGDFSLDEIEMAKKAGYDFVTLGNNRLRTETAGLYACMQCLLID